MKGTDDKIGKGILNTASRPSSKVRRVSWGDAKIKEFTKNDEVNAQHGEEYNIQLTNFIINEEPINECDKTITDSLHSSKSQPKEKDNNQTSNFNLITKPPAQEDAAGNTNSNTNTNINLNTNTNILSANATAILSKNPFLPSKLSTMNYNLNLCDSAEEGVSRMNNKGRLTLQSLNEIFHEKARAETDVNNIPLEQKCRISNESGTRGAGNINNHNRMTLILKEQVDRHYKEPHEEDSPKMANPKRFTLSLQEILSSAFNRDSKEDDLDNSFEMRLEEKRKELSASPINVNNKMIYHEACLSSASRTIERAEAKMNEGEAKPEKKNVEINANSNVNENNITNTNISQQTPKFEQDQADRRITIRNPSEMFERSPITINNPVIHESNLISPAVKLNFAFQGENVHSSSSSSNLLAYDKRIQLMVDSLSEMNKVRVKIITDLEKDIQSANTKIKEFNDEEKKFQQKKVQIKENISKISQEYEALLYKKCANQFPLDVFGIKVLSSECNQLKIQILRRINLNFSFRELNFYLIKKLLSDANSPASLFLSNFSFDILKTSPNFEDKLIDDENNYRIMKQIYEDLLSTFFNYSEVHILSFSLFLQKFIGIVKLSASFLYMMELLYLIQTIGMNVNLKYEKVGGAVLILFTLLNRQGFKINFLFEIDIKNSFYGVSFKEMEVNNICMTRKAYEKANARVKAFREDILHFFSVKEKMKNPLYIRDFFIKLYENVLNL